MHHAHAGAGSASPLTSAGSPRSGNGTSIASKSRGTTVLGNTARDAGVRLLALCHLSTRYFPREIRDEARAVFANTVVPRDFDAIEVPFPERGEPALVKGDREPAPA